MRTVAASFVFLRRLKRIAVNGFIAVVLAVVAIDTLPQSPTALHERLTPWLLRLGVNQGMWNLFAPEPDRVNTRLTADVTYRDGEKREWRGPSWNEVSIWQKWAGHRHVEWFDHGILPNNAPAWEPWCRHIARQARPELPDADKGAEVRLLYHEAEVPPASERPWPSMRQPMQFDEGWVLTIENL